MFNKILIANRGEIAVRISRACREMGIASVAVYSEADARALHVRAADEAVCIGPAPAAQSYLLTERILQAARQTGAEAVHPGYGFLSENAVFAQAVQEAGLVFIGPPPSAIRAMGDKAAARALMQAAGVPVVPGYQGLDDEAALQQAAAQIGYPVLAKAAAGGGGKGMRVITHPDQLLENLAAARREAQHAFGDQRLILEKYLAHAHHVEFQILGDQHGRLVHLFERECSVQRRHQKVIEESPSPLLDAELRQRMGAAAVLAARAAGYVNAGTIEFILDPLSRAYYFLEMNTRLQVEHPVTELVSGLDLVQWQIRIAAGEPFPYTQEQLSPRGHALECRLYAEDPANHFLPSAGTLLHWSEPQGPGIRLDAGVSSGDEVSIHYDPLLAKLICAGEDRPAAIRRMQTALRQLVPLGLTTNTAFLQAVLAAPAFAAGAVHTTWVDEHFAAWAPPPPAALPLEILAAAQLRTPIRTPPRRWVHRPSPSGGEGAFHPQDAHFPSPGVVPNDMERGGGVPAAGVRDPYSPWRPPTPAPSWLYAGDLHTLTLTPQGEGWLAETADAKASVTVLAEEPGVIILRLGDRMSGRVCRVDWAEDGARLWLASAGQVYLLEPPPAAAPRRPRGAAGKDLPGSQAAEATLRAPMPAQVRAIQAQPGEACQKGQTLVVLEAMKMEIRLQAQSTGLVERVLVAVGQQVNRDQALVEIKI